MLGGLKTARGILRSLRLYYGDRRRRERMDALYGAFVRPGDLAFDVGAHVGDRTASFRRLGACVVAIEPQPALARVLRALFWRDPRVTVVAAALASSERMATLHVNAHNPTVSTLSDEFIEAARAAPGWAGQAWTRRMEVRTTTLDTLIARHGMPAFIKVDVEGFEREVLDGLSRPPCGLSFEFTTMQRAEATACIERCSILGYPCFNAALGETQQLAHREWLSATEITAWVAGLPDRANSGDIYAAL